MRILVADDNKDSAQMLAILLEEWGFEPVLANDGMTALHLLEGTAAPMLALLDWNMPGMNGIDICQKIRRNLDRPYTYVLMVTGRSGKDQMVDGLKAGADDYLIKPVDPNELRARLSTGKRILDLQEQLLATQRQLREQATRDFLTGLWNRAMIMEILTREIGRSRREDTPLSVIMADIDHFKSINDTHGHLIGDQVLRQTALRLHTMLRPYDTVGRYGGEEFLVVLPGCDAEVSLTLAERLRHSVQAEPISGEGLLIRSVTLSLGVSTWDRNSSSQELLRTADSALYRAKREGRNRTIAAGATAG